MFYTHNKLQSGKIVRTVINEDNVFTHCPKCCEEVFVDLAVFIGSEGFDIYNTGIYCDDCSEEIRREREAKRANERQGEFAYVPENIRGCMTDAEMDAALSTMDLSPAEEKAVREVFKKGFVYAPELKEKRKKGRVRGGQT